MLYRHFPKIANKEISIVTAALTREYIREPAESAGRLDAFGVTAVYLPTEAREGVPEAIPPDFPGTVIAGLRAWNPETKDFAPDWAALIAAKQFRPDDLALADFTGFPAGAPGENAGKIAEAAGDFARTARRLAEKGLIAGFGFRVGSAGPRTADAAAGDSARDESAFEAAVRAIAGASENWTLWCADYSMANVPKLDRIVRELGEEGIPLLATDPFFGGALSNVAPEIHALYYAAPVPRAHEEWALRSIWENQNVLSAVIPTDSGADFAKRCIYAGAGRANSLPESELKVIRAAAEMLSER